MKPGHRILEEAEWPEAVAALGPRDKVFFYTDGILEAMSADGEEFGEARFYDLLRVYGTEPAPVLIERVSRALAEHRGPSAVSDDYTLLIADFG